MPSPKSQRNKTQKNSQPRRRANSSSPLLRKTKSIAQEFTEYKMKPDKVTKNDTLRFRLNRSRSVSGRLPRLNMSDDYGRGLRAEALTQSQRKANPKKFILNNLPLDILRGLNSEWFRPSNSNKEKEKLNKEIRVQYKELNRKSLPKFESRIRNNLNNLRIKIFDELQTRADRTAWYFFTYLRLWYIKDYGTLGNADIAKNAYANMYAIETKFTDTEKFYNDMITVGRQFEAHFQIVVDFHINLTTGNPQALFTIVPTSNLEEFRNISTEEKRKKCLYDGIIGNDYREFDDKTYRLFDDTGNERVADITASTRPNGVFVHEYVGEFEYNDHHPMYAQQLLAEYPNRPQNNNDYKSDLSNIVTNDIVVFSKYHTYYH